MYVTEYKHKEYGWQITKDGRFIPLGDIDMNTFKPHRIIWYCTKCRKETTQISDNIPPKKCYNCNFGEEDGRKSNE